MIAANGKDCKFYAIVLRAEADISDTSAGEIVPTEQIIGSIHRYTKDRIYHKYIDVVEDEQSPPTSITFKNTEKFIAIPAVDQLHEHDLEYPFRSPGVSAIVCTADGGKEFLRKATPEEIEDQTNYISDDKN